MLSAVAGLLLAGGAWAELAGELRGTALLSAAAAAAPGVTADGRDALSGDEGVWRGAPQVFTENVRPDGGRFIVYKFPLQFSNFTIYWRRFGVDIPRDVETVCAAGCPLLVDIHGSFGDVYTQRAWTKWYRYQAKTDKKFILLTVEGSPDAVTLPGEVLVGTNDTKEAELANLVDGSTTSWNTLGWGEQSDPLEASGICGQQTCFKIATEFQNAYPCFGTQQSKDPDACRSAPKGSGAVSPVVAANCASATAANDWDYFKLVLGFVIDSATCRAGRWCADRDHIYFTGQSMGGMTSYQLATPDPSSKYFLGDTPAGDLRPAAVVACSAGGSRRNQVNLEGKVPALLIQGAVDDIAPATVASGSRRAGGEVREVLRTVAFKELTREENLVMDSLELLNVRSGVPNKWDQRSALVLQADAQTGGAFLKNSLPKDWKYGCEDSMGRTTAIAGDYYMWETLPTTLQRFAGRSIDMSKLNFTSPQTLLPASSIRLQCADVDGTEAGVMKVCVFHGGHTYPWIDDGDEAVASFHDFVWMQFLKGGTLK